MPTPRIRHPKVVVLLIASGIALAAGLSWPGEAARGATDDPALMSRFEELSRNGNSSCSRAFMDSIATMPEAGRLQGSCCAPMKAHRYGEQVVALREYSHIPEIPPDPYDVSASLAHELMSHYDDELTAAEQAVYDYAMANSDEKGPCCCQCWRWYVYGGLAKILIREHAFDGPQLVEVWNLSSGCGGAEHQH